MFNWEGAGVTSHFMSLRILPLAGEARPFPFITPKHIFLRAYLLEPLNNAPSGANVSLDDRGNRSRRTQATPSFFLPVVVDATEAADSVTACPKHPRATGSLSLREPMWGGEEAPREVAQVPGWLSARSSVGLAMNGSESHLRAKPP